MAVIVLKFGGTSLHTREAREALFHKVSSCKKEGNDVVVVVSAMGRSGDPYATDTLISLLASVHENIDERKKDLAISCGETISAALVAHLLDVHDLPSVALAGFQAGIITDNRFGNSEILQIDTSTILRHLHENKIVVVAGFQGITRENEITTLGRGGSDTSAVILGGYLQAERIDIFTDVPGIALVDPRVVPTPYFLSHISYDTMYKLASNGAKVIHPRAVAAAKRFQIPVRVRSTFSDHCGTLISEDDEPLPHPCLGISIEKNVIPQQKITSAEYDDTSRVSIFFRKEAANQLNQLKNLVFTLAPESVEYSLEEARISFFIANDNLPSVVQQIYNSFFR